MTLNYTYGNDIIVTKSSDSYRGLSGDDIYIISKGLSSNSDITIIDTSGKNIIQLVDDINFIQTKITKDALQITISNNTSIRIYTGDGVDNSTTLYWGWYQGIWNNSGDFAIIQDENGYMVANYRY